MLEGRHDSSGFFGNEAVPLDYCIVQRIVVPSVSLVSGTIILIQWVVSTPVSLLNLSNLHIRGPLFFLCKNYGEH